MKAEPPAGGTGLRIVIDTNVWASAMLTQGLPARLIRLVAQRGQWVFSTATMAELEARVWKPKFDPYLDMDLRQRLLHDIQAAALWVEIPSDLALATFCRDPDDDIFFRTALAAGASWLVSGDRDILDAPAHPGLHVLAPAEALLLPEFLPGK